jgi:hypothetical protein
VCDRDSGSTVLPGLVGPRSVMDLHGLTTSTAHVHQLAPPCTRGRGRQGWRKEAAWGTRKDGCTRSNKGSGRVSNVESSKDGLPH